MMVLTIDLGGKHDDILIHSNDTPLNLAKEFCKKHNLSTDVESSISHYISLNLSKITDITPHTISKTPQYLIEPIPEILSQPNRLTRGKSNNLNSSAYLCKSAEKVRVASESNKSAEKRTKEVSAGERLYYQSINDLKIKEMQVSKILAEREASELERSTFRPVINNNKTARINSKPEIDLLLRDKILKQKLEQKRIESVEKELKDCTFHPKVNKSRGKIETVKIIDKNCYLYQVSRRKRDENLQKVPIK